MIVKKYGTSWKKKKNVLVTSAVGRNTVSFLDTQRYLTPPSSKKSVPICRRVLPQKCTAPRQSWKLRPNADEATQSLSPVPSASQHIYITNSARIHIICILHHQKVGIGCRQHGRRPFQQHQSRSLSASVGLIADEKEGEARNPI